MNLKAQKLFLFIFLLTGLKYNSLANNLIFFSDTINKKSDLYFDKEINKYANDSIKFDVENKKVFMYGNAKIEYKNTKINANYIEIDWIKNTIYATYSIDSTGRKIGLPILTENNDSFKAYEITYNFKTKKCYIKQISTKEGEGYILGKTVKKTKKDIFYLHKGDYTTCDSEKPHYSIRARKIKVIPGKKIITGPAYLTLFNIPTPILFPFGYFPNQDKQSSGIYDNLIRCSIGLEDPLDLTEDLISTINFHCDSVKI